MVAESLPEQGKDDPSSAPVESAPHVGGNPEDEDLLVDQGMAMEAMIRGLMIGELTAEVQRMQQAREAQAVGTAQNILGTKLGKPPSPSAEKKLGGKSGTSSFRAHILCMGDSCPELVAAVEDPAQGPMTLANWAP